ncbi:MAG: hypothetical protein J5J00_11575 [Deltaproteobacteria bacterium]|nr:hypothetical protein [Deltaproteobacteria bacterium]
MKEHFDGAMHVPTGKSVFPYFVLFTVFIALIASISAYGGPFQPRLEQAALQKASLFQRYPGVTVPDSLETYFLGPMNASPYLYELAIGKLLSLNSAGADSTTFLRYVNLTLAGMFFFASMLFALSSSSSQWVRVLFLCLLLTNSWTLLSFGSINADNFSFLMTALSLFLYSCYMRTGRASHLFITIAALLTGSLNDSFFLLLLGAMLLGPILTGKMLRSNYRGCGFTATAAVLMLIPNLYFYGGNLIRYGAFEPAADKVFGYQIAYRYVPDFRRQVDLAASQSQHPLFTLSGTVKQRLRALPEQLFESHSIGSQGLRRIDYLSLTLSMLAAIAGIGTAFVNRFRRKTFENSKIVRNRFIFEVLLVTALYLAMVLGVQVTRQLAGIPLSQRPPIELYPIIFALLFIVSHFTCAHLQTTAARIVAAGITASFLLNLNFQTALDHIHSVSAKEEASSAGEPDIKRSD